MISFYLKITILLKHSSNIGLSLQFIGLHSNKPWLTSLFSSLHPLIFTYISNAARDSSSYKKTHSKLFTYLFLKKHYYLNYEVNIALFQILSNSLWVFLDCYPILSFFMVYELLNENMY